MRNSVSTSGPLLIGGLLGHGAHMSHFMKATSTSISLLGVVNISDGGRGLGCGIGLSCDGARYGSFA